MEAITNEFLFKNKNFKKRDYEYTNVIYCIGDTAPDENWIKADYPTEKGLDFLYRQGSRRFYGWL